MAQICVGYCSAECFFLQRKLSFPFKLYHSERQNIHTKKAFKYAETDTKKDEFLPRPVLLIRPIGFTWHIQLAHISIGKLDSDRAKNSGAVMRGVGSTFAHAPYTLLKVIIAEIRVANIR